MGNRKKNKKLSKLDRQKESRERLKISLARALTQMELATQGARADNGVIIQDWLNGEDLDKVWTLAEKISKNIHEYVVVDSLIKEAERQYAA